MRRLVGVQIAIKTLRKWVAFKKNSGPIYMGQGREGHREVRDEGIFVISRPKYGYNESCRHLS